MMIKRLILALILLYGTASYADVAVVPYRVKNPSESFGLDTGGEYARLLTVTIALKSTLPVYSQRDLVLALRSYRIDAQKTLTAEDLTLLGEGKYIDYILAGSISRLDGQYVVESVLFSVREKRVLARNRVSGATLFEAAEREVHESFPQFLKKQRDVREKNMDIAFLVDMSYGINSEWAQIREGIIDIAGNMMGSGGIDARVYVVPFSDRYTFDKSVAAVNSVKTLSDGLNQLKPAGGFKKEHFEKSLRYAVQSLTWRRDAGHVLIIISNSSIPMSGFPERYGVVAKKKNIIINTLSLGRLKYDTSELQDQLAHITGGLHSYATYHQRLFDKDGRNVDLYFENGRLFHAPFPLSDWRNGILTVSPYQPGMARVRNGLDEIYESGSGKISGPYSLPEAYRELADGYIVSHQNLETNIPQIFRKMLASSTRGETQAVGRVLLSDGTLTMWADIPDEASLEFYRRQMSLGIYFPLGISIRNSSSDAYGIALVPMENRMNSDDIPEILKKKFDEIIKNRDYHMYRGLLSPSVWFVSVKVQQISAFRQRRDIRDE